MILKFSFEAFDWTLNMNYKSFGDIGVKEDHRIKNTVFAWLLAKTI
jgi:hypothetical protein